MLKLNINATYPARLKTQEESQQMQHYYFFQSILSNIFQMQNQFKSNKSTNNIGLILFSLQSSQILESNTFIHVHSLLNIYPLNQFLLLIQGKYPHY